MCNIRAFYIRSMNKVCLITRFKYDDSATESKLSGSFAMAVERKGDRLYLRYEQFSFTASP